MTQNVSPPGAGEDSPEASALKSAIGRIWIDRDQQMLRQASRLISYHRIELPDWDAEDAVQDTMVALCKAAVENSLPDFATDDDLRRYIRTAIGHQVLLAKNRYLTLKRGKGYRRSDVDLDQRPADMLSHVAKYDSWEALGRWLERMDDKVLQ